LNSLVVLLGGDKTNQSYFEHFLFHLIEVVVGVEFAHKKKLFLTCFAHRKFFLWKSGGLIFQLFSGSIPTTLSLHRPSK